MSLDTVEVVLFDAVGTLLRPEPAVGEAYRAAGALHGSRRSAEEITARFQAAFARSEAQAGAAVAERTDEAIERTRWRQIVADVFDDVAEHEPLFERLWQHFASAENWRLFDDVAAAWSALAAREFRIGVASNFDSRLRAICRELPSLAGCQALFISSEIGRRKPHASFFRAIERSLNVPARRLLLVGDTLENDYQAARAAGWQALVIDRRGELSTVPAEHKLRSLVELADRLAYPAAAIRHA